MAANTKSAKPERDELVLELLQADRQRDQTNTKARRERGVLSLLLRTPWSIGLPSLLQCPPSVPAQLAAIKARGAARHKTIREAERQPGRQREGQEDIERGSERDSQRQRDSARGRATARETIIEAARVAER